MRKLSLLVIVLLACSLNVKAADDRPIHEIHSMMVFNFIKYVNWPANTSSGDFVIGVIGSDDVYNTLNEWYTSKNRGSQKIVIKQFNSPSEIQGCHVVYVGKDASKNFEEINAKVSGASTLVITDKSGLGQKGSCINFKTVDGKLKFEIFVN